MSANRWLFLDMNSFFASVEQQENPALRGKPTIVVPVLSDTTCAIAVSYEAKAFGIKTGTGVKEAKSLCSSLNIVSGRTGIYRRYHKGIVEVLNEFFATIRVLSVDEMACRISPRASSSGLSGQSLDHSSSISVISCERSCRSVIWSILFSASSEAPNEIRSGARSRGQ